MPAAAAGAGVLVSAYSAVEGGKRADRAYALQEAGLAQDRAFRQQQLDQYNETYGPLIKSLTQQASSEEPLNLGPTWAKIQSNFDQAGRNNEAALARKGLLGSGIDRNNNLEVGRGMALSDAYSKGLQSKQALMQQLVEAGKRMPGQASAVMQGNENMAGFYGQQGGLYAGAAGQAWQGVGNGLGTLAWALTRGSGTQPAATAPGIDWSTTSPVGTDMSDARNSSMIRMAESPISSPMTAQDQSMAGYMVAPSDQGMYQQMFQSPIDSPAQSQMTPAFSLPSLNEGPWKLPS